MSRRSAARWAPAPTAGRAARRSRAFCPRRRAMQPDAFPPGTVWLVGAGPGDPELLTVKAVRLIEGADIVFYDALVGRSVLDLIPARTERVGAGTRSGRHSKDQATIDALPLGRAPCRERVLHTGRLRGS